MSRAPGDDDSYALRFFRDLTAAVGQVKGADGDAGFVDNGCHTDAGRGSPWSATAWDALMSCQAFVALCSPRYVLDDRCGREWWLFARRLARYQETTARSAPALIPVFWSHAGTPTAGGGRTGNGTTDPYWSDSVRQLIRLRSLRHRYQEYLASLAERIVATTEAHAIPRLDAEFDPSAVPNAFGDAGADDAVAQSPQLKALREAAAAAAPQVHFVVAGGNRYEMAEVRDDLQFYGDRDQDWAPYRPELPVSLAAHARAIASQRLFNSEIVGLKDLPGRIERARENNEIVVLLVDSWITKLAGHRDALRMFDTRDEPSVAVLAPTSGADLETARHRGELRSGLSDAIRHNLDRGDQLVRLEIDDSESFDTDLVAILEKVQNRIFRHGQVYRRPAAGGSSGRPILQGP